MPAQRDPLLECDGLEWTVGGARIVAGVDLTVHATEFVALIGPNGAGKTSLFNLLSGVTRPTAGRIRFGGVDITAEPPHRRARRGIGRTFQTSALFDTMTVGEHIALAARVGATRAGRRPAALHAVVARLADLVGLGGRVATTAAALSHGDKRKLEIALLLASQSTVDSSARLLLLDEPMAGVSAAEMPELVDVIRAAHRETGHGVLMVEHHMDVLLSLADRVAVLHNGALLAMGTADEIVADPVVRQAYLGAEV